MSGRKPLLQLSFGLLTLCFAGVAQQMFIPPQVGTMPAVDAVDLTVDYDTEIKPHLGRPLVRFSKSNYTDLQLRLDTCIWAALWCISHIHRGTSCDAVAHCHMI